jgi:hypothetical protein
LLPSPFTLQQKKERGLAATKPKQKVMVALLPSPSVLQQKEKKRKLVVAKKAMAALSSPSLLQHDQNKSKEKGLREGAYLQAQALGPALVSLQAFQSSHNQSSDNGVRGPASSALSWLCSHSNCSQALVLLQQLLNFGVALELWRWSERKIKGGRWGGGGGEIGGREVGRREKFWGRKEAEKVNNFGKGGCVFGSSPKRLQWPHPQLVNWWLLVHSSPTKHLSQIMFPQIMPLPLMLNKTN